MGSVFTKILNGELSGYFIDETRHAFAILALNQVQEGHCLVIPKSEYNHFFEVPEPAYSEVFQLAKRIGTAMKLAFDCERIATATIGLEVPHFHYHLVPISKLSDLDFTKSRILNPDRMIELQKLIQSKL